MRKGIYFTAIILTGVFFLALAQPPRDGLSDQLKRADTCLADEKYAQAESIYRQVLTDAPADSNEAFAAQRQLVRLYILSGDQAAGDLELAQLTGRFSTRADLPWAIWQIGQTYSSVEEYERAEQVHQYNVANYPHDTYAMWSQVEIVYSYIDRKDNAAADPAFEKLLALFAEQPTLPKEIHQIAMKYSGSGQGEKAYSLHQYNVEHFPDYNDLHVIWSQSELVRLDLQEGRYESACAGADKLLTWPPDQNDLPREIHVTAKRFAEAGKRDKAYELYLHNVDHFPTDMYAMWSQVEIVYSHIRDGNDAAADAACDKLLSLFSDQETLPKEVYQVAGAYNKAKRSDKAAELCRYIVEKWPKSDHALRAQRDLAMWSIDANDEFAAQAAVDKLLSDFSEHQGIAQVIHAVAQHYERAKGNLEKALELHRYNAEHFPSDVYAMWSQVEIVYFHIRDGNDAAADDAFDKLVTAFADQPTLPKEIYQVGDQYAKARNFDKAGALYQHVIANWPGTEYEMWARTGNVRIDILAGNQTAVEPAVDALIADFNDHPGLPQAVFGIGEEYFYTHQYQNAIDVWKLVLNNYPGRGPDMIPYLLATCYKQLKDYTRAIEYYTQLVEKYPDSRYGYRAPYNLGIMYRRLEDYESSVYWFGQQRKLYRVESTSQHAFFFEGIVYLFNMNEYQKAANIFQEYVELYPETENAPLALYDLALCDEKMGYKTQAIATLQAALRLYPNTTFAEDIANKLVELREEKQ